MSETGLRIEVGKRYRTGSGKVREIMGHAKQENGEPYADVFWASSGDWYRIDGRYMHGHSAMPVSSWRDLQDEDADEEVA